MQSLQEAVIIAESGSGVGGGLEEADAFHTRHQHSSFSGKVSN